MPKQPRGPGRGTTGRGTSASKPAKRPAAKPSAKSATKPAAKPAAKTSRQEIKPDAKPRASKPNAAPSKAAARTSARDAKAARVRKALLLAGQDELHTEARAKSGKLPQQALAKITIKVHKLVDRLIDEIESESGITRNELLIEAINLLLMAYNKKPIA